MIGKWIKEEFLCFVSDMTANFFSCCQTKYFIRFYPWMFNTSIFFPTLLATTVLQFLANITPSTTELYSSHNCWLVALTAVFQQLVELTAIILYMWSIDVFFFVRFGIKQKYKSKIFFSKKTLNTTIGVSRGYAKPSGGYDDINVSGYWDVTSLPV